MRPIFLLTFCCLLANPLLAQTTLNIDQSFALLASQNEALRQANINVLLATVDVKDARNAFLPTLSFNAGHTYNMGLAFDQIAGQLVTGNKWSNTANANLSTRTTLFQGFSQINKLKQALLSLESKAIQQNQLRQSLKLELLARYFDATANHALYEISLKQLQYAQEQLEQERAKFALQTNTLVDVAQAESQVATNELSGIVSNTACNSSLVALKQLLGIPLTDTVQLETPNQDIAATAPQHGDSLPAHDPAIQLAALSLQQSTLNLRYARAPYYPTISFFSGYGTNYSSERKDYMSGHYMPFGDQVNQNKALNFGVSLSMPVFDAFKTRNNISRLKLDLQQKQSELNKVKTEREKVLIMATQEYQKSVKEYQVLQVQYHALEKNYQAMKERYDIGETSAMEYNKALLDYNVAAANVIKAKYTLMYNVEVLRVLRGER
ncbi:TolC family protein [Chitinophaga nivalis]|uniref:TolC family protein n=1 Tax=Chitinophaga nivalis TaxID=2991709 RepID=A0ABT3IHB1_9BACT|nr:TolC family protein [Chitinophaga nivalis]MCW3467003.1 TolC family protein [Chitinophaga nivalis]MCW3483306.1 TolC family protein [Chitinophaga nivalis]